MKNFHFQKPFRLKMYWKQWIFFFREKEKDRKKKFIIYFLLFLILKNISNISPETENVTFMVKYCLWHLSCQSLYWFAGHFSRKKQLVCLFFLMFLFAFIYFLLTSWCFDFVFISPSRLHMYLFQFSFPPLILCDFTARKMFTNVLAWHI